MVVEGDILQWIAVPAAITAKAMTGLLLHVFGRQQHPVTVIVFSYFSLASCRPRTELPIISESIFFVVVAVVTPKTMILIYPSFYAVLHKHINAQSVID